MGMWQIQKQIPIIYILIVTLLFHSQDHRLTLPVVLILKNRML